MGMWRGERGGYRGSVERGKRWTSWEWGEGRGVDIVRMGRGVDIVGMGRGERVDIVRMGRRERGGQRGIWERGEGGRRGTIVRAMLIV